MLGHILGEVLILWLKVGFVVVAYRFARFCTPSTRMSTFGRLVCYAKCAGAVAFIGLIASGRHDPDTGDLCGVDYTRGAIVFLALLGPAMLGMVEGFRTPHESRPLPPLPDNGPDM
jgi:hypothetical protein